MFSNYSENPKGPPTLREPYLRLMDITAPLHPNKKPKKYNHAMKIKLCIYQTAIKHDAPYSTLIEVFKEGSEILWIFEFAANSHQ